MTEASGSSRPLGRSPDGPTAKRQVRLLKASVLLLELVLKAPLEVNKKRKRDGRC